MKSKSRNRKNKPKKRKYKKINRYSNKHLPKSKKSIRKKRKKRKKKVIDCILNELFGGIVEIEDGLRTYYAANSRYNGVHPEQSIFQQYNWCGLITLKFHKGSHTSDSPIGIKNRSDFTFKLMENLRNKLKISHTEWNWIACEEFGDSGDGHHHVVFSFDYLIEKNRLDKLKIHDFSENGHFLNKLRESANYVSIKLGLNPQTIKIHWSPKWKDEGLVNYFCKKEFGRDEKRFIYSKFWQKMGLCKAA